MWTFVGLVALLGCASAITRDQFYPHGQGLDQRLPRGHEVSSPELGLKVPIVFYGETYDTIFVNNYGVLTFRADIPSFVNAEFPLPYPSIAVLYTNVDTTETGTVYYRETNESHVLSKAEESVQNNFHDYYDFRPKSVFIATWIDVTYTGERPDRKNSFQVAVISNGTESFVEFLYPEREIQWIQREVPPSSLPDAKAQAGFVAEDGQLFTLRGSGSHQIRNIVSWSNVQEPGKYVFRVGNISHDSNIAVPDQYNQYEVEIEEESKTCAQSGPSVCHTQAKCVDYQAGICCQCLEGFYGNGKSCIKDDVPLRVHGKLNGNLNDIPLNNVDIQAYVVVADGRSYTAISQASPNLGGSLQLLSVLGGVIGWLFAKPSGAAKNGYQLTGSVFNYSAEIFFPATNERVIINQEYLGHDVFDQITLECDIRGTVPVLLPDTKLEMTEYEEQYRFERIGITHSESTRTFTNKITGEKYEQRVSQTFTYNACRYAAASEDDLNLATILKVTKNYLGYESKENIIRYGTSNKIFLSGGEDPCINGRSTCPPHSTCVPQSDSFSCVCQSGFTNIYQDDGTVCIDIDECEANSHNCDANADCYNHDGGFQCRCRAGFEGNGVNCNRISQCRDKQCDINGQCLESHEGEPRCVCNPGYTGDGERCWQANQYTCDVLHNCSPYASCAFASEKNSYICICHVGYFGDGYYCSDDIPTTTATKEAEYNETFVLPNCDVYGCVCPPGYTRYKDDRKNDLCIESSHFITHYTSPPTTLETPNFQVDNDTSITCDTDADCQPNAMCDYSSAFYSESAGKYLGHCVCPEGYEGDAYECIERTGPNCTCGPKAHCFQTGPEELICVCDQGYHGDGYNCRPTLSCTNDSDCESHAECRPDSFGLNHYTPNVNFLCECVEGYIKDQNDACIRDEQLCNGALCSEHASCLYDPMIGVNYCHCDLGYDGDGISHCVLQGNGQGFNICNLANDCHEHAVCTPTEHLYQCVCKEDYVGDGYTCIPEISCRTNPYLCDSRASCLKRSDVYICECNSGYNGNGTHCVLNPKQAGNFLVASDGVFVYRVPFEISNRDFATPINSAIDQIAVGVDVDCHTGRIYWGDVVSNTIKRASYDGSAFEVFLTRNVKSPEGLAIDWGARNIFWTDSKRLTIEVANLETKIRKVLFSDSGISNPRGIAVHPQRGKIFWTDWNRSDPKIEWANMDGSQRGVFLDKNDVKLPNSLAIDWSRDRLCYADAGLFSIKCVGIDTRDRETIASNCSYPFGLAINDDKFYWTDWKTLKIEYIDTLTEIKGQVPIATAARRLYGVAIAPDQCPASSNACHSTRSWNADCKPDELCLPDGRGGRSCVVGDFVGEKTSH